MATSVHLPKPLLDAVDRRARALKISRNRLIVKALERELANTSEWSSEFFQALETVDSDTRDAMDELLEEVRARRTSKGPPKL
ncbi:MAG: ribbon-helix-helix protein, CopG family [Polyangiaceae bacterium]|nr:ribbon-helix-helix protein, CopG family [Polyangiaceae bacterium]